MNVDEKKKLDQELFEYSVHQLISERKELDSLYKEGSLFFIGVFMFLSGIIFNLAANVLYELIKDSWPWKVAVLILGGATLVLLLWLIEKYISKPISSKEAKLLKLKESAHAALDKVFLNMPKD